MLYHVVAMSRNRVIGKGGKLPWHFSSDLKHFKELTTGSTVIMGRKTFESIGKPLPGRENFVVSRKPGDSHFFRGQVESNKAYLSPKKVTVTWFLRFAQDDTARLKFFSSLNSALHAIATPNAFVIGGAEIYRATVDKVNGIYLTLIDADYEGDAFYPEIPKAFKEKSRKLLQENPKIEVIYYEKR